jgi:Arc/MetJ-type ribon-helix-helix transcriptional regulator
LAPHLGGGVSDQNLDTNRKTRVLYVRVPNSIEQQIEGLAARDANSVSSVVRRLLVSALKVERDREARRVG